MATADRADAVLAHADRLLDNDYVQDKLREAGEKMRAAIRRGSKRRVQPTRDEKMRGQLRDAGLALNEAATAFRTGRSKPKPRWGVRLLVVSGLGVVAGAVALAASDDLREKLFGAESDAPTGAQPATDAPPATVSPVA